MTTNSNIRYLLRPAKVGNARDIIINRHRGGTVANFSLMPSAFFVFDKTYSENGLSSITFHGGGYGHGVGMSQNGVRGMIDAGLNFEQVLRNYYRGAVLVKKW
jgi:stage II sporulation protein D